MADGQVVFEIKANNGNAKQSLEDVVSTARKAGQEVDKSFSDAGTTGKQSASDIGTAFTTMFATISAAAIAAKVGSTLKEWAAESIEAASNLQETQNVVDTTFGESSSSIDEWAKNAQKQYGLTETQAKRYASTMGAMAKSSGVSDDAIVEMSTDMAGLAADMASFYNMDFDEAFAKIRSGLAGETEPLRALGLNMTVKNLEDFAKSQGVDKAFDKMTQAEQMSLRYQYLMQSTADAQGDFVRTSDSYANNVRKLETNMETLKINAGEMLLPIVNDVVSGINAMVESLNGDDVKTAMQRLAEIGSSTADKKWDMNEQIQQARSLAAALDEIPESLQGGASGDRVRMGIISELLQVMPELGSIIDAQTGEIEGGTAAVHEFISAWAETQGIEISLDDLSAKQDAVTQSTKDLEDAYKNLAKARGELAAAQGGWWGQAKAQGDESAAYQYIADHLQEINDQFGKNADAETWFETFAQAEGDALMAIEKAEQEVSRLGGSLEEAQAAVEETASGLGELADSAGEAGDAIDGTADAFTGFSADAEASIKEAVNAMGPALEQMVEMWESTREGIADSVGKMFEGFDFKMPELGEGAPTADSMAQSLQDQITYIEEYTAALEKLKESGASSEVLSNLSSGSEEDFAYLKALADATPEQIATINQAYADAQAKREEFINSLTTTTLEGDDTFTQLATQVETGTAAIQTALESADLAGAADVPLSDLLSTVQSYSTSIGTAIDALLANVQKLEGLNLNGWSGGRSGVSTDNGVPHATGLDYVPFNGYHARLHEGEAILTAEQSRVWRGMLNGPTNSNSALDYGALGGVIRENAPKAGGDVYLDGRTVGRVISARQADSYRTYERSGYQG